MLQHKKDINQKKKSVFLGKAEKTTEKRSYNFCILFWSGCHDRNNQKQLI